MCGEVAIPINTLYVDVLFPKPMETGYIVLATNIYSYSSKIVYSIAFQGKNGFKIYPVDTVTGTTPIFQTNAYWLAIKIKD